MSIRQIVIKDLGDKLGWVRFMRTRSPESAVNMFASIEIHVSEQNARMACPHKRHDELALAIWYEPPSYYKDQSEIYYKLCGVQDDENVDVGIVAGMIITELSMRMLGVED